MIRKIIAIDETKCNGCGLCATACHEGAIALTGGKARLIRDDYCDGLGDCLPICPVQAINFIEREAPPYDEQAVARKRQTIEQPTDRRGCPGENTPSSCLRQWPVQLKLAPVTAPYFDGSDILIAADCAAYTYGDFHRHFLRDKIVLIGCPKLDAVDYSDKLAAMLKANTVKSLTVVRMAVPCCAGIERAAASALQNSGRDIALQTVVIDTDGHVRS